jgi:hypothetical protein
MELEVDPQKKLAKLGKLMKQAPKELTKAVNKGLRESIAPLKKEVTTNTGNYLPRKGGLSTRASRAKLRHRITKSKNARVSIIAPADPRVFRDPLRVERGRIKHPVFGMAHSRNNWVFQDVIPGWFTRPLEESAPIVEKKLINEIDRFTSEIERRI